MNDTRSKREIVEDIVDDGIMLEDEAWDHVNKNYSRWKREEENKKPLMRAAASHQSAKELGGKALTGTAKQKAWAEKLRSDVLAAVSREVGEKIVNDRRLQSSKWWIENRDKYQHTGIYYFTESLGFGK